MDSPLWPGNCNRSFTEFEAWIDLIMMVNYAEKPWRGTIVKRGEIITSAGNLATRWKWDKSKVRRYLNRLKNSKQIDARTVPASDTQAKHGATRISIVNYNTYNPARHSSDPRGDTRPTRVPNPTKRIKNKEEEKHGSNEPENEHQFDKLKNYPERGIYSEFFMTTWSDYPSKSGKKEAARHWNSTIKNEDDVLRITMALEKYKLHLKMNSWKHPMNGKTWFNNWQDWENWVEPKKNGKFIPKVGEYDPHGEQIIKVFDGGNYRTDNNGYVYDADKDIYRKVK